MIYQNYRAKTLFTGYKIGEKNAKLYVGVPNTKGANVVVFYKDDQMRITDEEGFIKWGEWLPDKTYQNNGKDYRLGYYEWKPQPNEARDKKQIVDTANKIFSD